MAPKLDAQLAQALDEHDGQITTVHPRTGEPIITITQQRLQGLLFDDEGTLTADEMLAAAAAGNRGRDGWDAPGMEVYDGPEYDDPQV